MRQFKRVFYVVLLNVIVTATTMLVVLNLWENRRPPTAETLPSATSLPSETLPAEAAAAPILEDTPIPLPNETLPTPPAPTLALTPYEVQEGDSLGSIATAFDLRIADLLAVNNIPNPDILTVGQVIYIPAGPVPTATPLPPPTDTPMPSATTTRFATAAPSPTPSATSPGDEPGIRISGVTGPGSLESERVQLSRTGEGSLSLAGWQLEDEDGNVYTFPQLTLFKGGAINVNSRGGQNTAVDLYWGLSAPAWRSGEMVTLRDAQGEVRATYQVP